MLYSNLIYVFSEHDRDILMDFGLLLLESHPENNIYILGPMEIEDTDLIEKFGIKDYTVSRTLAI